MHRNKIHRIFAFTMALLVMVSSSGIAMDMHYCMGQLKNVNIFGKAQTCHDSPSIEKKAHCKKAKKSCHKSDQTSKEEKQANTCCNNQLIEFQNDADLIPIINAPLTISDIEISFDPIVWSILDNDSNHSLKEYLIYKPPIQVQDIPILIQSFLL